MRGGSGAGGQTRGAADMGAAGGAAGAQVTNARPSRARTERDRMGRAVMLKDSPYLQKSVMPAVRVTHILIVFIFVAEMDLQFAELPVRIDPRRKLIFVYQGAALLLQA